MNKLIKILIVGGYGTFGGRLVELLENESRLILIVAGRSSEKAQSFCKSRIDIKASLVPAVFNRGQNPGQQLKLIQPDIVVDASGPFQSYGNEAYALVEACIQNKIHYMDLADASGFVDGIGRFEQDAKEAGVFVLSGVSSFPVLSSLVVRELSSDIKKVHSIRAGVAPSPYAGIGGNVIRAIAGYAGKGIDLHQAGCVDTVYPLTSTMRYTISPPGYLPLKKILFSLVDVPDLRVLAKIRPDAQKIWVGAGPVPEILHRILIAFAWSVRMGLLKTLSPLANLMDWVVAHVRWGEHRGGMFVEIEGDEFNRSWHLLAEGQDGPYIPSMGIEAVIRKILEGRIPEAGARTALEDLSLDDYNRVFAQKTIYTGVREDRAGDKSPLYKKILGSAYESLPELIQELHNLNDTSEYQGQATIARGKNIFSKIIAKVFCFPVAAEDIDVGVNFSCHKKIESWTRTFGNKSFTSYQYGGKRKSERMLVERFGILRFTLALVQKDQRLYLITRRWTCLGVPFPLWIGPKSDSYESVENGKFHFNVKISYPLIGLIVHYHGWLERKS